MAGQAETTARIAAAAEALAAGELVAFPTETVYGLGADATNDAAVAKVYAAKGRPRFNPLIVHVPDAAAAFALGEFPDEAKALARAFWPGPLTIVVKRAEPCPVSLLASAGGDTIALRVPSHPLALGLLAALARPVVAPSANPSGRISPTTAAHVEAGLGGRIAMVLDGGASPVGVESTVVSFADGPAVLLRPGGLDREAIERVLGIRLKAAAKEAPGTALAAPGRMESHYAPRAAVRLNVTAPQPGEALLAFGPELPATAGPLRNLSPAGDLTEAAANLFCYLHELDALGVAAIAVMPIPHEGLGEAINDRLARAAAPR